VKKFQNHAAPPSYDLVARKYPRYPIFHRIPDVRRSKTPAPNAKSHIQYSIQKARTPMYIVINPDPSSQAHQPISSSSPHNLGTSVARLDY
jgi:hypothetical protein